MSSRPTRYEQMKSRAHRGKHLGGPGKPDYTRGPAVGEVKDRKRPVTGPELQRLVKRGVTEVDSKGGFTTPAVKAAKKLGVKLFSRKKRVR